MMIRDVVYDKNQDAGWSTANKLDVDCVLNE